MNSLRRELYEFKSLYKKHKGIAITQILTLFMMYHLATLETPNIHLTKGSLRAILSDRDECVTKIDWTGNHCVSERFESIRMLDGEPSGDERHLASRDGLLYLVSNKGNILTPGYNRIYEPKSGSGTKEQTFFAFGNQDRGAVRINRNGKIIERFGKAYGGDGFFGNSTQVVLYEKGVKRTLDVINLGRKHHIRRKM